MNTEDSFVDTAIVYLNNEKNETACHKREKIILCEFLYSGGRDILSFNNVTVFVMINHSMLYVKPSFNGALLQGDVKCSPLKRNQFVRFAVLLGFLI